MHFHSVTDSLLGVKVAQGQAAVLKYSAFVELREKERVVKPGVPISNNVRPFTTQESRWGGNGQTDTGRENGIIQERNSWLQVVQLLEYPTR